MIKSLCNTELNNMLKVEFNSLSHAYLFYSKDKQLNNDIAELFSHIIFCENHIPCFECAGCKKTELNKNPDIKDRGSYIRPDGRCLDIRCSQEDLIPTLRLIKSKFIDAEIDPKHLEEAKMLAPIGLSLDRKINESPGIYYDLPTEISEEDYEKYAKTFTMEDLDKYNKEVLKNTDKELCLYSNRKFYEENKEEIEEIIKNWF